VRSDSSGSEKHTAQALAPLTAVGHHLLADRAWPGADVAGALPPEGGAERERWELRRRELYVGMTRARDGLWVGVV